MNEVRFREGLRGPASACEGLRAPASTSWSLVTARPDTKCRRPRAQRSRTKLRHAASSAEHRGAQPGGLQRIGSDRIDRRETDNWQRLEDVRWMKNDGSSEVIPLVEKMSHIFRTVLAQRSDMDFKQRRKWCLLRCRPIGRRRPGCRSTTWFSIGKTTRVSMRRCAPPQARTFSHSHSSLPMLTASCITWRRCSSCASGAEQQVAKLEQAKEQAQAQAPPLPPPPPPPPPLAPTV